MREILELQQEAIERQRKKVSELAERGMDDEEFIRENLILDRMIERYIELKASEEELLYQED